MTHDVPISDLIKLIRLNVSTIKKLNLVRLLPSDLDTIIDCLENLMQLRILYHHSDDVHLEPIVSKIAEKFPNLTYFHLPMGYLQSMWVSDTASANRLLKFKNLRNIDSRLNIYGLNQIMNKFGHEIEDLTITNHGLPHLQDLKSCATNLRTLVINEWHVRWYDSFTGFPKLKSLVIHAEDELDVNDLIKVIKKMLLISPKLRLLLLGIQFTCIVNSTVEDLDGVTELITSYAKQHPKRQITFGCHRFSEEKCVRLRNYRTLMFRILE